MKTKKKSAAPPFIEHKYEPPTDIEMSVLSKLCQLPDTTLPQCRAAGVARDWFSDPACALLWDFITERLEQGQPLDIVSLIQALNSMGKLSAAGGPPALFECLLGTADPNTLPNHLAILRRNRNKHQPPARSTT